MVISPNPTNRENGATQGMEGRLKGVPGGRPVYKTDHKNDSAFRAYGEKGPHTPYGN